jgi:peptidoglycan L-alanyl-D-glutamate endopeptidase CwlK
MFHYGKRSLDNLSTCDSDLIIVANRGLELSPYDITIIHGWRGEELQNALQESGASTKRWPNSKHNNLDRFHNPMSLAFDFAPWIDGKIPWDDTHIFAVIAGCLMAAARENDVQVRWGGDWDSDGSTKDQKLLDWGHLEKVT